MTTETIAQQTRAARMAFHLRDRLNLEHGREENGPFIGFVASLSVLIALALWQFSVLTSDAHFSNPSASGKPESGPLDSNQVRSALSRSPK